MSFDMDRARAFGQQLVELYGAGMTATMIDVGVRTGLFDALAQGSGSSEEIAQRAGITERPAREWLAGMTTAGIIEHDAGVFTLPAEHAVLLTGDSHYNLTPLARVVTATAAETGRIARAVTDGQGIAHDEFDEELAEHIDAMSRRRFDAMLIDAYLPKTEITARLEEGGRIADLGCGAGHAVNLLAAAYPAAEVIGIDISEQALTRARLEAERMELDNVRFVAADATDITNHGPIDLVTAFDVIHDLPDPEAALEAVHRALTADGRLLMYETSAPSDLDEQTELYWAPLTYGLSIAHCLQVSRAGGGDGVGTMWGRDQATLTLSNAGFTDIESHDAPGDPMNAIYVATP